MFKLHRMIGSIFGPPGLKTPQIEVNRLEKLALRHIFRFKPKEEIPEHKVET